MKKLILLLIFSTTLVAQTEVGNFKIVDEEIIWQKVYEEDLPLESQDVELRAIGLPVMTTTIWLSNIAGAKMKIDKKDGKTRVTIIDIYSVSNTQMDFGVVKENIKPSYADEIYYKRKKRVFSRLFMRKDNKLINVIIEKAIDKLLPKEEQDDW
tara:strand:+ start:117 stop:578 length:462 start_codon:yes stop_codon:yes gene_type:complete